MNWNLRYAADKMGPDTFFAGEGLLKVGPKNYPAERDYAELLENMRSRGTVLEAVRGGKVKFPNGHSVSVDWWANRHGEHPTHVDVSYNPPQGSHVRDFPGHSSLSDIFPGSWASGTNLDHHQVNSLMEHVKGL